MNFINKSGQPRSNEELEEALKQVEKTMAKDMLRIPPDLAVYLTTIREALVELIHIREVM